MRRERDVQGASDQGFSWETFPKEEEGRLFR